MAQSQLPEELEAFVREQLEMGAYETREELLCEGVRALREREQLFAEHRDDLRAQIAEGVEAADRGEIVDGREAMERIQRRLDDAAEG